MQKNDETRPEPEVGQDGLVPIYHHETGLESRVLPKAVRGWERQGWSTEKAPASDAAPSGTDGGTDADKPATEVAAAVAPAGARAKSEVAPAAKSK